ncbi:hypothetical protein FOY32_03980 [Corynebacterium glutamicum]|nr:hypothetical protein FOL53_14010 [Corynebacterium glutamicum]QDQ22773.1 hypothetical protein FOY32_03980 [Corynebacterium glutamicum]
MPWCDLEAVGCLIRALRLQLFGSSRQFGAPQKVKPDRRDKNLRFRQILSRLSGLDPEKPNTRAKTSVF